MSKLSVRGVQTCPVAFQSALDDLDVVGTWEWDAVTDRARVDAIVALLFNVDPQAADESLPLADFVCSIHPDDQERVVGLIRRGAREGSPYIAEYRVCSVDGATRWVLDRGRFFCDHAGRPLRGRGIIVDITRARIAEELIVTAPGELNEPPLERAAGYAIAAGQAIAEMADRDLKVLVDALLLGLGRKLAQQDLRERRERLN